MKKLISTLAIAGLGAGVAVGAHAQTVNVNSAGTGLYSLQVVAAPVTGSYNYSYLVTLESNPDNLNIDTFTIDNALGYVAGSSGVVDTPGSHSQFGAFGGTDTPDGKGVSFFTPGIGFEDDGDSATFSYSTTQPDTSVTFGTTAVATANTPGGVNAVINGGNISGTGGVTFSSAVPEAGSFALLGLGLVPLAFLARRRAVRGN